MNAVSDRLLCELPVVPLDAAWIRVVNQQAVMASGSFHTSLLGRRVASGIHADLPRGDRVTGVVVKVVLRVTLWVADGRIHEVNLGLRVLAELAEDRPGRWVAAPVDAGRPLPSAPQHEIDVRSHVVRDGAAVDHDELRGLALDRHYYSVLRATATGDYR